MSKQNSEKAKFASLSSGLLARKGDARPAMRRPTAEMPHHSDEYGSDLGWNDLGDDEPRQGSGIRKRITMPAIAADEYDASDMIGEEAAASAIRPVIREMKIKARRRGHGRAEGPAAFTLRLDAERHLRLRLACAVHNVSAQRLVTEALDELLASMPEIEPLTERVASA